MVIRASDRVSAVLARDERFVELLAGLAPAFQRLRNPIMRRTMARLVTVEQAARMAGLDPAALVGELNRALEAGVGARPAEAAGRTAGTPATGASAAPRGGDAPAPATISDRSGAAPAGSADAARALRDAAAPAADDAPPAALAALPPERIVELDVRDDLRRGEEPFSRIMAARREIPDDGALRLRAIFEPVPLYAVLAKQGFAHWTQRLADDDWCVWFYRPEAPAGDLGAARPAEEPGRAGASEDAPAAARDGTPPGDDDVVVLDVRGLEPPEPMVRTLAALEELPPGRTLVQINVREPRFLLPLLDERGFVYEVRPQGRELVRVFIRRAADS